MTDDHILGDGRDQNSPPAQLLLLTDEEAKKKRAWPSQMPGQCWCCGQKEASVPNFNLNPRSYDYRQDLQLEAHQYILEYPGTLWCILKILCLCSHIYFSRESEPAFQQLLKGIRDSKLVKPTGLGLLKNKSSSRLLKMHLKMSTIFAKNPSDNCFLLKVHMLIWFTYAQIHDKSLFKPQTIIFKWSQKP